MSDEIEPICVKCGRDHNGKCRGHRSGRVNGELVPCARAPMTLQQVCSTHGGKSPQAAARVARDLARQAAISDVGRLLGDAYDDISTMSGIEQLTAAITHAGSMALSYRRLLDQLPEHSAWSYMDVQADSGSMQRFVDIDDDGLLGVDSKGVMRLHAYEGAYRHWTRLWGDLLKAAATLGLDERRLAVTEAQMDRIGAAIVAMVAALGRDLDDPTVVPVVEQALRAIVGGET